jgi:HK97 gp10 family phage protein
MMAGEMVTFFGIKEFAQALEQAGKDSLTASEKACAAAANECKDEWQARLVTVDATGVSKPGLIKSITVNPIRGPKNVVGYECGSNVLHAKFVEYGTSPHFPPIDALVPWAQAHRSKFGMANNKGKNKSFSGDARKKSSELSRIRSIAFLVARAISKHGTKPRPTFEPAVKKAQSLFERLLGVS